MKSLLYNVVTIGVFLLHGNSAMAALETNDFGLGDVANVNSNAPESTPTENSPDSMESTEVLFNNATATPIPNSVPPANEVAPPTNSAPAGLAPSNTPVAASETPIPAPATSESTTTPPAAVAPPVSAEAALTGDGSIAPVDSNQSRGPNEFGGVAPLPGTLREMAVGEAPEIYSVEEGDTMYDVCNQLIDDGNFWPKLWSINPDVKNPHFIYELLY